MSMVNLSDLMDDSKRTIPSGVPETKSLNCAGGEEVADVGLVDAWHLETVQARFTRATAELQFLGDPF